MRVMIYRLVLRTTSPTSSSSSSERARAERGRGRTVERRGTGGQEIAHGLHDRRDTKTHSAAAAATISVRPPRGRRLHVRSDRQRGVRGFLRRHATAVHVPAAPLLNRRHEYYT